jgi:hypothetical protein
MEKTTTKGKRFNFPTDAFKHTEVSNTDDSLLLAYLNSTKTSIEVFVQT